LPNLSPLSRFATDVVLASLRMAAEPAYC